ncbi:MAG: GNAT family protein [Paracoccaceae bacterium]
MTFRLRPATPADIGYIRSLTTRPDYTPFIGDSPAADLQAWIDSPACAVLIAEQAGQPTGFAIFREIGDPSGRVELFRIALDRAGGGRGDAFFNALLDYGFATLNARRVWLDASGENPRAIRIYTRAGCVVEGIQRTHWYRPCLGRAVDLHLMAMMRDEWRARRT